VSPSGQIGQLAQPDEDIIGQPLVPPQLLGWQADLDFVGAVLGVAASYCGNN
jgi:hypothetical protein